MTQRLDARSIARGTLLAAAVAAAAWSGGAHAQSAGTTMLRGGITEIKPEVKSGDLSPPALPGTQATVRSATQISGGLTTMVTDNVAIDIPLALPFKHEIDGAGAIGGVGKIGDVRALPITLLGQYRFLDAKSPLRPYVGAGVTYAKFFRANSTAPLSAMTGGTPANPTTLKIDSKFAATLQVGASVQLNDRWFLDGGLTHTFLKTRATLSTGQTLDLKLDPDSASITVGYRF